MYMAAGSYALIVGSIFSDKQVAMTLMPVVVTPLMLFAGYFANSNSIPVFLIEFEYISFFKWGLQALMWNQYDDIQLSCMFLPSDSGAYCNPLLDFDSPQDMGRSMLALFIMYVVCYIVSLSIMKMLSSTYE